MTHPSQWEPNGASLCQCQCPSLLLRDTALSPKYSQGHGGCHEWPLLAASATFVLEIPLSPLKRKMRDGGTRRGRGQATPRTAAEQGPAPAAHLAPGISNNWNDYPGLDQKTLHGMIKTSFPHLTQAALSSLSYLIPTWSCFSYGLSQALTAAFFYGFSIQQMFLFHSWADPTTACLATDRSSSPTAAPTWRGKGQRPLEERRYFLSLLSLSLSFTSIC